MITIPFIVTTLTFAIVTLAYGKQWRSDNARITRAGKQIMTSFLRWAIYQFAETRGKPDKMSKVGWFLAKLTFFLAIVWVWWAYIEALMDI